MLGFSPLASAPIGDDGVTIAYGLEGITAGSPVVNSSSLTQEHSITANSVTAGSPSVGATGGTTSTLQTYTVAENDIVMGTIYVTIGVGLTVTGLVEDLFRVAMQINV